MKPCPKCSHVRQSSDTNPAWQCPACGVAYDKFVEATTRSAPLPSRRKDPRDKSISPPTAFKVRHALIGAVGLVALFKLSIEHMPWTWKNKAATPTFMPGVKINDPVIRTFNLSGTNFPELNESMLKVGPFDAATNRRWWGFTRWNISWKFLHATHGGQCQIDQFALTLDGVIELPEFVNQSFATEEVKTKWDSFIGALRTHEYGHWRNGIDATNELEKRLLQITPKPDCETLDLEIKTLGDQVMQEYREVDEQYDRFTNHGINQGATF
jgi:predicted secreted Zn-dependent protease